jgi:hypothetical protein
MHPVQLALHPQPGLIETGHLGLGDPVFDLVEDLLQPLGRTPVILATVPSDTGVPNNSANACAVRFLDMNCPTCR